jgi:hypothetical protein
MAGLVPAIHVFFDYAPRKTWMPGTRPGMTARLEATLDHPQNLGKSGNASLPP